MSIHRQRQVDDTVTRASSRPAWNAPVRVVIVVITVTGMLVAIPLFSTVQNPALVVAVLCYTVVGFVLTGRRPENALGWVFLASGCLIGASGLAIPLDHLAQTAPDPLPPYAWIGTWFGDTVWPTELALLTVVPLMIYPSGHVSRRMRPALWALIASLGAMSLATAIQPYFTWDQNPRHLKNPLSPPFMADAGDVQNSALFGLGGLVFLACGILALASLGLRLRRSCGIERQQLRWFVFAAALLGIVFIVGNLIPHLVSDTVSNVLMAVSVSFIPAACGIAILRYRLYDLDRVVSRTASYAVVTGVLFATYAVVVTSVSRLLGETSTLAVAAATLAAAALFRPLLARVQRVIDRRFNRERVDHERAVDDFAAQLRDQIDADLAGDELSDVVRKILEPVTVVLLLRADA